jgi:outer membrane protein assembly factor BamB
VRRRTDLVEVEIPTAPARARGPRWVALGAALLAAAVLLQGHGSATRATRLAGVEVAPSLAAPWHTAWTAPGKVLAVRRDVVVLSGPDGTGALAMDAAGTVLWGPVEQGRPCAPAADAVICRTISATGSAGAVTAEGTRREAVAIDDAGNVTATFRPQGALSSWWFLDGTVVAVAQVQGHLVVDRWAPDGLRWHYRSSDAMVAPVSYPFSIERGDGWLLIGGTRAVLLDLATGTEIATRASAERPEPADPAFGLRDRSVPGLALSRDGAKVEGAVDGGPRWRVATPLWALVDGVVVAGGVVAVDARTGVPLWSAAGDGAFSDGDLVGVVGDGALTARRVRDGTAVWQVPAAGSFAGLTDQGVVLAGDTVAFLAP